MTLFNNLKSRLRRAMLPSLKVARRLAKDKRGSAVEFAMVSVPFFPLLLSVFEIGMIFFKSEYLQSAVTEASRQIYTGQAQQANMSASQFKTRLCDAANVMFSCADLSVDVRTYSGFSGADRFNPVSGGDFNNASLQYDPGVRSSIVVVTGYYQQQVFLAMLASGFDKLNNGKILLRASAAFRNEPF